MVDVIVRHSHNVGRDVLNDRHLNVIPPDSRDKVPLLCIVVPCYNEEEVLPQSGSILASTVDNLIGKGKVSPESRIIFVDDGSKDST